MTSRAAKILALAVADNKNYEFRNFKTTTYAKEISKEKIGHVKSVFNISNSSDKILNIGTCDDKFYTDVVIPVGEELVAVKTPAPTPTTDAYWGGAMPLDGTGCNETGFINSQPSMAEFMTALPHLSADLHGHPPLSPQPTPPRVAYPLDHAPPMQHGSPGVNVPEYPWMKEKKTTRKSSQQNSDSDYIPEEESDSNLPSEILKINNTKYSAIKLNFDVPKSETVTIQKKYFCIFCKKYVHRFARHVINSHKNDVKVQNILRYPAKHPERNRLISLLRNEGTFVSNTETKYNNGQLIVSRRPSASKSRSSSNYSPCPHCHGYYISKNLFRHIRLCPANSKAQKNRQVKSQSRAIEIELDLKHLDLHTNVSWLLSEMKNDEIGHVIKGDFLLLRFASYLCRKYNSEMHLKHYARQKLRQLARLLIIVKEDNRHIIDMRDLMHPKYFNKIIIGVQKLCKFNAKTGEFKIPSMANHIGMYLKECLNIYYSLCLMEQNHADKKKILDLKELFAIEYGASISRSARRTLEESKWNKPKLLPFISDIKLFRDHLISEADKAYNSVEKSFSYIAWRKLLEVTAAILLMFNRKRPGETERILLKNYLERQSVEKDSEDFKTLTTLEKILCTSFQRVEIRGKLGRRVPILVKNSHIRYIDMILRYRKDAEVADNNIYLFGLGRNNYVRLTDVLRREAHSSNAANPELLRATQLRKQVATTSQLLDLNENEMQLLADFMGHDIAIHKAHYRTPELTLQVARLSKLLMAVDEGDLSAYKDKNLKSLNVDKYLVVNEETEIYEEDRLNEINYSEVSSHNMYTLNSPTSCGTSMDPNLVENGSQEIAQNNGDFIATECSSTEKDLNLKQSVKNSGIILERDDYADSSPAVSSDDTYQPDKTLFTPPKRPKIQRKTWKTPEKRVIRTYFNHHLINKTLPSYSECEKLRKKNPELYRRTAAQIKAYINNENRRKKLFE